MDGGPSGRGRTSRGERQGPEGCEGGHAVKSRMDRRQALKVIISTPIVAVAATTAAPVSASPPDHGMKTLSVLFTIRDDGNWRDELVYRIDEMFRVVGPHVDPMSLVEADLEFEENEENIPLKSVSVRASGILDCPGVAIVACIKLGVGQSIIQHNVAMAERIETLLARLPDEEAERELDKIDEADILIADQVLDGLKQVGVSVVVPAKSLGYDLALGRVDPDGIMFRLNNGASTWYEGSHIYEGDLTN